MKSIITLRRAIVLSLMSVTLVLVSSCAHKIQFQQSAVVPAAEGTVKIKKDKNNNYSIEVSVNHLAQPGKLPVPKDIYVVWAETASNGTKNIGQLKSSSAFLSKALKASLHTVSSFEPERIFITAENDAAVSYPSGQNVLTTASL